MEKDQVFQGRARAMSSHLTDKPSLREAVLWAVDFKGSIIRMSANGRLEHVPLPDCWEARHIAALRSDVWVTAADGYRHRLFHLACNGQSWIESANLESGSPIRSDVEGSVWQIEQTALRKIGNFQPVEQIELEFPPVDVSFGSDGTLWALGGGRRFGGSFVWRYLAAEGRWLQLHAPAAATRICGAPDGTAWTINSRGDLWRLHPNGAGGFNECGFNPDCRNCFYSSGPNGMRDLSVDMNGTVWFVTQKGGDCDMLCVMTDFTTRRSRRMPLSTRLRSIAASIIAPASVE